MNSFRACHIGVLLLLLAGGVVPATAVAKMIGYIVTLDGTVLTLDTDSDTIITRRTVPDLAWPTDGDRRLYLSGPDNLLVIARTDSQPRDGSGLFRVAAYDLTTLAVRKQDLGIVAVGSPDIIIPPGTRHFFVIWFDAGANGGQGARRATRFDKATFAQLGEAAQVPRRFGNCTSFSPDGSRLYNLICQ